ncbi:MAG: cation diffusion facilitator family transporter [Methylococcaceae bacterium]|nr:cation diffusion facilitator family transporter [Methylococcaceae bacterium]
MENHSHHQHGHASNQYGKAFVIGIGLNLLFVMAEAVYGWVGHSVALLADAGHNFADVLGLLLAFLASGLSKRLPSPRFTYGFKGTSILAALLNAVLLLVSVGAIVWESIQRLQDPQPVSTNIIIWVAGIGIVINGMTAMMFASGRHADINIRGAFLHLAADALVSLAVVGSGLIIGWTHWYWLDPAMSLFVSLLVIRGTWGLLKESIALSLAAVPKGVDYPAVRAWLASNPQVDEVHDLHIWPMGTTEVALTGHLVMPAGHPGDAFLHSLADELQHRFGIHHVTLQIEVNPVTSCPLAVESVI